MKLKLFLLLLLTACAGLFAQQLSKLPKEERDRKLIEIALKVW